MNSTSKKAPLRVAVGKALKRMARRRARVAAVALSILLSTATAVLGVAGIPPAFLFLGTLTLLIAGALAVEAGAARTYRAIGRLMLALALTQCVFFLELAIYHWLWNKEQPAAVSATMKAPRRPVAAGKVLLRGRVTNFTNHDAFWLVTPSTVGGYDIVDPIDVNKDGTWKDQAPVFNPGTKRGTHARLMLVVLADAPTERTYDQVDTLLGLESLSDGIVTPHVVAQVGLQASGIG
jgi:hypothetical protein